MSSCDILCANGERQGPLQAANEVSVDCNKTYTKSTCSSSAVSSLPLSKFFSLRVLSLGKYGVNTTLERRLNKRSVCNCKKAHISGHGEHVLSHRQDLEGWDLPHSSRGRYLPTTIHCSIRSTVQETPCLIPKHQHEQRAHIREPDIIFHHPSLVIIPKSHILPDEIW